MNQYWKKKATPWVTIAVLCGGMFSALLLFWLVNIEKQIEILTVGVDY